RICKRPIADEYFEIARAVICAPCANTLGGSKGGRGAFGRALLFGVGAALLGTIVWYAIVKITDHEFGLLAIGVGLFVGVAVKRGGRGRGGWRYQALAMILTYVSITGAYVPLVLKAAVENPGNATKADAPAASANAGSPPAGAGAEQKPGAGSFALALGLLLGLAFIAPFMGGASNIMGILIIGIGLYEAWKINRRVPLSGPFRFGPAPRPLIATPGVPPGATP
ncbi:MAG TPA: hypothetical protein VI456_06715, partial [Polyangia bacterium]